MSKRIVLQVTKGAYAGLFQICGTDDALLAGIKGSARDNHGQLPTFMGSIRCFNHEGSASLVAVKERYILYQEIISPEEANAVATFHPDQQ